MLERLQQEQMICLGADTFSFDSTVIKVHPDVKKSPQSIGKSCGGWRDKFASTCSIRYKCLLIFFLFHGQSGSAPEGDYRF